MTVHRRTLHPADLLQHGTLCRPDLGMDDDDYADYWSASATHDPVFTVPRALPQGRGVSALGPGRADHRHGLLRHRWGLSGGPRAGRICRGGAR